MDVLCSSNPIGLKKHRKVNEKPFGNTIGKTKEFCTRLTALWIAVAFKADFFFLLQISLMNSSKSIYFFVL
jgi:hypothetical protein